MKHFINPEMVLKLVLNNCQLNYQKSEEKHVFLREILHCYENVIKKKKECYFLNDFLCIPG